MRRPQVDQPSDHRLIVLADMSTVKVSIEDYEFLNTTPWHALPGGYAVDRDSQRMHRIIANRMTSGGVGELHVDHENTDTSDNRRTNLRIATRGENAKNRSLNKNNKSGYKGVFKYRDGRWAASIRCDTVQYHIGYFATPQEGAWMRDQWAIELHGDFALLNFTYE